MLDSGVVDQVLVVINESMSWSLLGTKKSKGGYSGTGVVVQDNLDQGFVWPKGLD